MRHLRGTPYDLDMAEIVRRSQEAWERGATEVCLQGGIHPDYTGDTYVDICKAIKAAVPGMHIHAFSPLEVTQGAATLGLTLAEFLARAEGRRPWHAAGHRGGNPGRRNPRDHLPRQDQHRSNGSMSLEPRTRLACAPPPPSCTATSRAR